MPLRGVMRYDTKFCDLVRCGAVRRNVLRSDAISAFDTAAQAALVCATRLICKLGAVSRGSPPYRSKNLPEANPPKGDPKRGIRPKKHVTNTLNLFLLHLSMLFFRTPPPGFQVARGWGVPHLRHAGQHTIQIMIMRLHIYIYIYTHVYIYIYIYTHLAMFNSQTRRDEAVLVEATSVLAC